MAKNPKFNNSDMFTGVNSNDYSEVKPDNNSEVLATQGNVINSIKVFWNKLKEKLAFAITRDDTSKAVGGNYQPIFVNTNGGVQVCEPGTIEGEVKQGNIKLDEIDSPYPGQIVCINVTKTSTTVNTNNLTINNIPVYYLTNVQVKVSDVIGSTYLFTYIEGGGDKWILNNKINFVSTNNPGLMTADQCSKLVGIDPEANKYILPTADNNTIGGVKLGYTTNTTSKNYKVQKDDNANLYVNVPWTDSDTHNTALLRAGGNNNNNNESTQNGNTYLKIVDGSTTSKIKISGSEGTTVTSDAQGNITISSPTVPSYSLLNTANNLSSGKYLIKGPGSDKANTNYFLAGNGTWVRGILVPIPTEEGKTLKSNSNGTVYWG